MANFGRSKTWTAETLTSSDLNAEFDNIITNVTSGGINSDNIDETDAYGWTGAHTFGVDDTGVDVKMFGASAGAFLLWDESADLLEVRGATAAGAGHLKLTTGELTVVDGDVLGRIDFQAPLESDGTDAVAVAASIWAEADDTFGAALNDTDLVFAVAESETAAERMRLSYDGTTVGLDFSGVASIGTGGNNNLTLNSGTASVVTTGNVVSDTDSTDDLGTSSVRWASLYVDNIGDTGQTLTVTGSVNFDSDTLFVDHSNNRVGIGTAAPGGKLHAVDTGNITGRFDSTGTYAGVSMNAVGTTSNGKVVVRATADDMQLVSGGLIAMTLDSSQNVGIGTTTPAASESDWTGVLHVENGVSPAIVLVDSSTTQENTFGTSGSGLIISSSGNATASNNYIAFRTEDTNSAYSPTIRMQIQSDGDIDIGTAAIGTTATAGFLNIPSCAGTPTGTPTPTTGLASVVYDSTNNKLYVYDGAWTAIN